MLLKKFAEYLKNNEFTEKISQDVISAVKNYRALCINIVYNYHKIREISSHSIWVGKYAMDDLYKMYNYDKLYLVKVIK